MGGMIVNITNKKSLFIGLGGSLTFASIAVGRDWRDNAIPGVWLPVQNYRREAFFLFGILTLILVLMQFGRQRGKGVSLAAWMLVALGMFAALLRFIHSGPADGLFSVAFVLATAVPITLLPGLLIDDREDFLRILRVVVFVNVIWLGMCALQFVVTPRYLTTGVEFRFLGLLSNPQHAAALMAFMSITTLWLLLNDHTKRYKLLYIALTGINFILIAWTGSRTGMGMAAVGLSAVLYARIGRAILLMPVVGLFVVVIFKLIGQTEGLGTGLTRLASTENTRSEAWQTLLDTGASAPFIGVGAENSERSENSWLYAFATNGIFAFALAIVATLIMMWDMLQLGLKRFFVVPVLRPYIDYTLGIVLMYLAGGVFEGYMMARIGAPTVLILLVLGMLSVLKKNLIPDEAYYAEHEDGYGDEYADNDGS